MTGKRAAERVLAQYVNDGSCVRLRAGHRHHVRAYGFVQARTHEGRSSRMLMPVNECREYLDAVLGIFQHLRQQLS